MKIKSLLVASTIVFTGLSGANAADAIQYEEPVPVVSAPTFSWGGAYIGGQVGYGWAKSQFDGDVYTTGDVKPSGFLGGLYAGYNFDLGNNVVLGIDGDITYNDQSEGVEVFDADTVVGAYENKLRWSGAARARAGYAIDRFLPYIAGGVAFGSIKNSGNLFGENFSESKTHTGWTIGGGVDYAATDNLILRLEYRYTDYGKKDFDFAGLCAKASSDFGS